MVELEFVDSIYDPVWKNIPITQLEKEIIECDIFRRLRNIRQMSLAYISFLGANHTRFEHSLGTMHVAYLIANKIKDLKKYSNQFFSEKFGEKQGYKITLQFIRIAALLHDLGHPPFSHAIEWVFERNPKLFPGKKYSHDNYTYDLIKKDVELHKILGENKFFSTDDISDFLAKELKEIPKPIAILYPLLNGDLDFDKVDYIIRDNYHCGLPVNIDINSIMDSFEIVLPIMDVDKQKDDFPNIDINLKSEKLYVVENLLLSRKQLITAIQQDRKNRIANHMLMTSTSKLFEKIQNNSTEKEYLSIIQKLHEKWTDFDLIAKINENLQLDKKTYDYSIRALKGDLLREILKIDMRELSPIERLEFYIFNKYKDKRIKVQNKLNEKLKTNYLVDFNFIKPPPLEMKIIFSYEEMKIHRDYGYEPVTYSLQSASNIVNGILKDSYLNSFIAVYGEKLKNNIEFIKEELLNEIKKQSEKIRVKLVKQKNILAEDLILLILSAIRDFSDSKFQHSRLWATGVTNFQKFVYNFKETISFDCIDLKYLSPKYSSEFDVILEMLTTIGIIDQRQKNVPVPTETDDKIQFRYLNRKDYTINTRGENFVEGLPKEYHEVKNTLFEKLIDNKQLYFQYFAEKFNILKDPKQKGEEKRTKLKERNLPILGI